MDYRTRLAPWAIFRLLTPVNVCVARFRTRPEAEEYLKVLRRLSPERYQLVFDIGRDNLAI
ncbi:MAG TPA: hypothetical protein VK203_00210 [Nostocaceae cyanobacterium]|nr:hypothetical protein [Nostocaceae cyanobacterium]